MNIEDLKGCFANITDDDVLRDNGNLYAENKKLKEEIERLNNIIKEVREYIEKMEKLHFDYSYEKQELLEILDKGEQK